MRVRLVDDPRTEVGEDVRVGVRVGAVECQLYLTQSIQHTDRLKRHWARGLTDKCRTNAVPKLQQWLFAMQKLQLIQ